MSNKVKYLCMMLLCIITGASASIMGGTSAIIYGAILSAGLAAVIPIVNHMKLRGSWSITRQVIAGGIAGLIIGLILWLIDISINKFFPTLRLPESWDRSALILIGAPVIYGIIVHLAHGLCCYFKTTKRFFIVLNYIAFAVSGIITMLPLVFLPHILLLVFLAPWFSNLPFAILWGCIIRYWDPMFPDNPIESKRMKKLRNCLEILYLMVIPGLFGTMGLHLDYRDALFTLENHNKMLLAKSRGIIYANDLLQLPQEKVLGIECKQLQHHPDSPDGSKRASLETTEQYSDKTKVIITDNKTGNILLETKGSYLKYGICWHPSGDSVIAVQKNGEKYLLTRLFMDGKTEIFDYGIYPRLAEKTGDIAFVRDEWLYLRKAGSANAEKKRKLLLYPVLWPQKVVNYDISPDGKMIVAGVRMHNQILHHISKTVLYSLEQDEPGYILPICISFNRPCIWFENVEALKQAMKKTAKTKESNGK
jgi:hypothetical protein